MGTLYYSMFFTHHTLIDTPSVVAALPDLYELYIGQYDAPLTDQFTAQVLTSITKSRLKVLDVSSSSPVLLQEALLSSNKMESLHTLSLLNETRQVSACSYAKLDGFHLFSLPHYSLYCAKKDG